MTFNSPERTISPSTNLPTARSALGDGHLPGDHVVQRAVREIPASGVLLYRLSCSMSYRSRHPKAKSRGPVKVSWMCAVRTLSTTGRSPGLAGFARGVRLVHVGQRWHDVLTDRVGV